MRSSLDPHISVSIISDRQRLKSILYITMMCEIMHQTCVASHGDLPSLHHFVTVKGDRFVGSRAFSRMAFLLCMQKTSHRNSGELCQVAELPFAGVPTRVLLHDRAESRTPRRAHRRHRPLMRSLDPQPEPAVIPWGVLRNRDSLCL